MTNRDDLINEAFNLAVAHIQKALGVTDGGFAALWFDGDREDTVLNLLGAYYDAEEKFSQPEPGDMQVNDTEYEGRIVIEQYGAYHSDDTLTWAVPAWEERGAADLEGPFATRAEAQAALDQFLIDHA